MKKFLILLIMFVLINPKLQATNQYIEYSSGEKDDGSIYLDTYEDYLNAIGEVDDQKLYKQEYEYMIQNAIMSYDLSERVDTVKAKVLSVDKEKEYYSNDGYSAYKIKYQPITVQILEGEQKGKTYDVSYILTADTYENLKIKPVKENQTINVIIQGEEAYATTVDAAVNRFGTVIFLILFTILFVAIYIGKNGFKILPQMILLADLILLIFVPELLEGRSILWLTIITSLLYMIVESVIKVGINTKMVATIFTNIAVILITTLVLYWASDIANFSGITYEIVSIVETFPKGTIDFYMLYISSFILMSVIVVSDISCQTVNLYANEAEKNAKIKVKEYVASKLPLIFGILLIMIIPKYLYTLIAQYTFEELINSEMLTTDIVRILFLIISATLTTQVAAYAKKMFVDDEVKNKVKKIKK